MKTDNSHSDDSHIDFSSYVGSLTNDEAIQILHLRLQRKLQQSKAAADQISRMLQLLADGADESALAQEELEKRMNQITKHFAKCAEIQSSTDYQSYIELTLNQ